MVDSKPLIQIKPDYTRVLKKIKAGAEYSAQIPTMEPNVHDFENPRPAWPVNKTVCLYQVEPWSFSLSAPTMKRLYDWCSAKNLSLLEYGYCIVTEQTDNGDISYHRACFLFKKLKHALIFKLSWSGITDEID